MGEMGRAYDGSYAEYALLPNEQIYPVDSQLSWSELASSSTRDLLYRFWLLQKSADKRRRFNLSPSCDKWRWISFLKIGKGAIPTESCSWRSSFSR